RVEGGGVRVACSAESAPSASESCPNRVELTGWALLRGRRTSLLLDLDDSELERFVVTENEADQHGWSVGSISIVLSSTRDLATNQPKRLSFSTNPPWH